MANMVDITGSFCIAGKDLPYSGNPFTLIRTPLYRGRMYKTNKLAYLPITCNVRI